LVARNIAKPYYHWGLYNGKAMNQLMTCSSILMEDIQKMLLNTPCNGRCSDDEIVWHTERVKNVLKVFDEVFSLARITSGKLMEELSNALSDRVYESM
jgi:hypothetical protein